MIVIIPLGGKGKRFKENKYNLPKALIEVNGKPIISYLLDNLNVEKIDYIFIPYNHEYKSYQFEEFLTNKYKNICFKFFCMENDTKGAAETLNIGINNLKEEKNTSVICLDCDSFYLCDIISKWNGKNCVFTIEDFNSNPIYSYIKKNINEEIIEIKEKDKISNFACTGAYGFESLLSLKEYTGIIVKKNITQKNEFYTSGVIQYMINEGQIFNNVEILNKDFFSLGTPSQLEEYKVPYIFDLDGTLVHTDDIYIKVWNNIMSKYNLSIDTNFFNFFIQGKNDISFLKKICPMINDNEIEKISVLKDELFINYLSVENKDITINGARKFIENNKNRRMGIVTSCNRKAAEFILKKTKLNNYMNFLVASEDCLQHKPNKEPYQKAINLLNCNNCIIFEDSNSGYKSAKQIDGAKICLLLNNKSSEFIKKTNEYKIENYDDFDDLKINNNMNLILKKSIMKKLNSVPIVDIIFENTNIKTGYICDICSLKIIYNNSIENIICKIENEENELSNVARKINLYNNEVYFYEKISQIINIQIPKFYCCVNLNNKQNILLENLNDYKGCFDYNLNNNIDMLLLVVKNITEMHNRFYFKSEQEVIPIMKNLLKINEIKYYKELIDNRYDNFIKNNLILLSEKDREILHRIYLNYEKLINLSSSFPLSFCHGDLKSPNIFYKEESNKNITPFFLDWQYIHLNKGISDIVFLLVESTEFDENLINVVIYYYFNKSINYKNIEKLLFDFKVSLCVFPFFVLVWFNSENRDNLLDKVFPINFMKNTLKFYNKFLDQEFFKSITL